MNTVVRMAASLGVATLTLGLAACGGESESDDPNNTDDGATTAATTTGSGTGDGDGDGGGSPETGTQTLQSALDDFGACMSIEVFIETGVYRLYEDIAIDGGAGEKSCGSCHSGGLGGAYISDDVEAMFEGFSTFPGVMRVVTGTVGEDGNFNTLVPSNRLIDKGIEPCYPGEERCHPTYDLSSEMQRAVLTFTEVSLERWESGECDAPYNPELD